jgi:hypothetical protein
MFRKILIPVVASLSLLSPLALPSQSEAREVYRHVHRFHLYYRGCPREAWRCGGDFSCRADLSVPATVSTSVASRSTSAKIPLKSEW